MPVTLTHIAERVNLSARSVSCALNGQPGVSQRTRERIERVAREMGYRPNAAARSMRSSRTKQVGVMVQNDRFDRMTHLLAFETILGINQGLEDAGYVVSLVRIGDVRKGLDSGSNVFREHVLDGIIVCCAMPDAIDEEIVKLIPNVVWVESQTYRDQYCIRRDEYTSGGLCAEHMISLGYRRIVWVGHPTTYKDPLRPEYSAVEREKGVRDAAEQSGVPVDMFLCAYDDPSMYPEASDFFKSLSADTAVIAGQAYQARWLHGASTTLGIVPPADFGLCCCDDGYDVSSMWPGLSRVSFNRYEMGTIAADMLRWRMECPERSCPSQVVTGQWVPGNTAWGPNYRNKTSVLL